jgi:hypothetical protein
MGDPSGQMGYFIDVRKAINPNPQLQSVGSDNYDNPPADSRWRLQTKDGAGKNPSGTCAQDFSNTNPNRSPVNQQLT